MTVSCRRQLGLLEEPARRDHGGELAVGKRKCARPIVTRRAMHWVLRSELAQGDFSLLKKGNARFIEQELKRLSIRFRVRVYEFSNNGNHLHLAVRAHTRDGFKGFLRTFCGHVAQFVTKAVRGKPFGRRFWTLPAYSRIVEWRRDFRNV